MTQDNRSDFEKRRLKAACEYRDRKFQDPDIRVPATWATKREEEIARIHSWSGVMRGYDKGFTDPLVEAMESDIEKLYQIAVREHDMYPMRVCEFLEEIYLNGSYAAYRAAKAKLKGSGE